MHIFMHCNAHSSIHIACGMYNYALARLHQLGLTSHLFFFGIQSVVVQELSLAI